MAEQVWWYILRKVGLHTLNDGAAIGSFVLLSYIIRLWLPEGRLRTILDDIEGVVLIVMFLIFACQVIYDVLPGKIRGFVTSKFVFA
jgi:hypothetical protein